MKKVPVIIVLCLCIVGNMAYQKRGIFYTVFTAIYHVAHLFLTTVFTKYINII
jgi:hypothetical protein